jgi:hypothetical protein
MRLLFLLFGFKSPALTFFGFSVGNRWTAAGMLRVLGTISNAQYNTSMASERTDLVNWITEIHGGMYKNLVSRPSYFFCRIKTSAYAPPLSLGCQLHIQELRRPTPSITNFFDTASTSPALMASTAYRLDLIAV